MKCEKCNYELNYGAKFCNNCGEKVPKDAYKEIYDKTVWGYADKFLNWYDTLFLKKITDNIIFKIALLIVILAIGLFNTYSAYSNIRLLKSESYDIEYDKKLGIYYILTQKEQVSIQMYIPKSADTVVVTGITDGEKISINELSREEFSEGIVAKKNEFDSINVSMSKDDATTDNVVLVVK